ncbi:hypothetical protein L1887_60616 [Cichorium endivia]|nr:hypothetical protein L1887_60616 [Cichorium endivia]
MVVVLTEGGGDEFVHLISGGCLNADGRPDSGTAGRATGAVAGQTRQGCVCRISSSTAAAAAAAAAAPQPCKTQMQPGPKEGFPGGRKKVIEAAMRKPSIRMYRVWAAGHPCFSAASPASLDAAMRRQSSGPDEPRLEPSGDFHLEFELGLLALSRDFLRHAFPKESKILRSSSQRGSSDCKQSPVPLARPARLCRRRRRRRRSAVAAPLKVVHADRQSANTYRERIGRSGEARRGMQPIHPYEQPPPFLGGSMQSHHHSCLPSSPFAFRCACLCRLGSGQSDDVDNDERRPVSKPPLASPFSNVTTVVATDSPPPLQSSLGPTCGHGASQGRLHDRCVAGPCVPAGFLGQAHGRRQRSRFSKSDAHIRRAAHLPTWPTRRQRRECGVLQAIMLACSSSSKLAISRAETIQQRAQKTAATKYAERSTKAPHPRRRHVTPTRGVKVLRNLRQAFRLDPLRSGPQKNRAIGLAVFAACFHKSHKLLAHAVRKTEATNSGLLF